MGRSVRDAALFYNAVAGPHVGDPYSDYPLEKIDLDWTNTSVKGKRIAFSADLGFYKLAPDVRAVFEEALLKLETAGAVLMPAQIDWDERVIKTAMAHQAQNMAKNLLQDPFTDSQLAQMTPYFRWYVDTAPQYTQQDFILADGYSDAMRRDMTRVMQTADLLLCPTVCTTDIPNNLDATRDEVIIDGKAVDPIKGWFMTYPFNTLSEFPVISVPAGFARNNVPIGVQIVAGPRNERLAFEAASTLEQLVGFFPRSPLPLRRHSSPPKRTTSRLR
jgi:amidase